MSKISLNRRPAAAIEKMPRKYPALPVNYIGAQIKAEIAGRTLLGDVVNAWPVNNSNNDIALQVRHFNGEPWPYDPLLSNVTILDREKPAKCICGPVINDYCPHHSPVPPGVS